MLYDAKTFDHKVSVVENYLMKQFYANYEKYKLQRILHSISLINKTRGNIDIDNLASRTCLSRKQFERIFIQHVGSSPKQFLKVVRFQNSLHLKQQNPNKTISDIVFECGYFDQSHLIRDFKNLSGYTPKQFFNECEVYSDYFV